MSGYPLCYVPTVFNNQAMELLVQANKQGLDTVAARQLLATSPLDEASLEWHGRLLTRYLKAMGKGHDAGDTALLASYLHALAALPVEAWMKEASYHQTRGAITSPSYRPRPLYDGVQGVTAVLEGHGMQTSHPLLQQAVGQGLLDPTHVWRRLNAGLDAQNEYLRDKHGAPSPLPKTAQGLFLRALRPLILDTAWRPADTSMYEQLWGVHGPGTFAGDGLASGVCPRNDEFVRFLLSMGDEQLHGALQYMAQHEMDQSTLDLFFPLPLKDCVAIAVLHALLLLFSPGESVSRTSTREGLFVRMRAHHQNLLDLIEVHLQMFPGPFEAQSQVDVLLEPFDRLRGRLEPFMANIDGDVFEGRQEAH